MKKTILIVGTLDTKGEEHLFLKKRIEERGFRTIVVDAGILDPPFFPPDISREEVCQAAGFTLAGLIARKDKNLAIETIAAGSALIAQRLYAEGKLDGIISLGGGQGTYIGTTAMKNLPYGVPKVMVSTVASGDVSGYVDTMDITMMHSIIDILGINAFSKQVFTQAAYAVCAMAEAAQLPQEKEKRLIGITMFGITTPCIMKVNKLMGERNPDYDLVAFHARGAGGKTMERLIRQGVISAVLDVSTTELIDELVGGIRSAGPHRLEAAAEMSIPQVVCPGAIDSVNFGPPDTVPLKFVGRNFFCHSPVTTLMRSNVSENERLGQWIAEKLNRGRGKTTVVVPTEGFSVLDKEGQPFFDPEADAAFIRGLKGNIAPRIKVVEFKGHITDDGFAEVIWREFNIIMG
ncbi:MAG: Tm-1-like ATP-binding domain-containing protein [Thermodesulfobacteriota bacterium]|nr:Tm-1-like ATP-binding domain-containing protein [Thermodesulfobacteriota bacterium]